MSRRRQANRAEAIVRGIGAIIMLIFLLGMVNGMPSLLRGKDPAAALGAMLTALTYVVVLFGAVTVLGLVVWCIVLQRLRRPSSSVTITQSVSRPAPSPSAPSCADCGRPITSGIAHYCQRRPARFLGKSLCMPCQANYRR